VADVGHLLQAGEGVFGALQHVDYLAIIDSASNCDHIEMIIN
jgi:hypothetical protein